MPRRFYFVSLCTVMLLGAGLCGAAKAAEVEAPRLVLEHGNHISYLGNTLADRMQHDGWLETLIQHRFPKHELEFRNLSFPGDELNRRPRSENFGSPDEWLTQVKTDVIFAFFGYNESFAGEAGLAGFRQELAKFIDHTAQQKYNGKSAPRLVLFSPIAHENLKDPNLPDGSENNARLAAYTKAMAEVAAEKKVLFVDLFAPSAALYAKAAKPLTLNGVHLTPEGDRQLALVIDQALFGGQPLADTAPLEKLRQAVVDKNFHWFSRYRTVDGYNVFGGRSKLAWFGQSNADVMKREMEIFDVLTANREKRVWAIAAGGDLTVNDSNTPPEVVVKTNIPGPLKDGSFPFLSGEDGIAKMKIAPGLQVNLFASEEQFPDLIKPVQMSVDTDGRLWAATWPTYPHWNPKEPLADKIVILPDDNGDGRADRLIVFADGLNSVTGFEFWGGGVLVAAAPEILFLKDTDGDDRADVKIRMLQGISAEDTHHTANALVIGPDGGLYFSHGVFHVDNSETPTKTFRSTDSGVYRFDPRTYEVDFHFPIGPNPHGDVFDQWGYQFANDGTGGAGSYINIGKGQGATKNWFKQRVRPVPATGILSSSQFPPENNGNFLICNSIGVLGVLQYKVEYDGADINAVEIEPILISSDSNFRPTDLEVGGDGALYVSDWQNPIIGHMQHNIRDPNRDHKHGRIYRVTAKDRPLLKPVKMTGQPIDAVLKNFYAKENGTRYRARLELSGRPTKDVTAAVAKWAAGIEPTTPENEQALLEALWVFEEHRVPNVALAAKVLRAKEPRARAAAARTLGHWGSKAVGAEPLVIAAARDEEPLVRAEAIKASVGFDGLGAAEIIFEAAIRPTDQQLNLALDYARSKVNVDKVVNDSLKSGQKLSLAAQAYVLRNAKVDDLLKMERSEAVYMAILSRADAPAAPLRESLAGLAKIRNVRETDLLLGMIDEQDAAQKAGPLAPLCNLLIDRPPAELRGLVDRLAKLAATGKTPATREAAYAAWIEADGSADNAFAEAAKSKDGLREFLAAIPRIPNAELRGALFARIRPLLTELPANLTGEQGGALIAASGITVEYYATYPANVAIESLARLKPKAVGIVPEITLNVPQRTANDGYSLQFSGLLQIDQAGKYNFYLSSDDGSRFYLDKQLLIDNDGPHGMAEKGAAIELAPGLHPIVVTYYNATGGSGLDVSYSGPNISRQSLPKTKLLVASGENLHDVAIGVLQAIPGHEDEKFLDLAGLVKSGRNRPSAIAALRKIPKEHWQKDQVRPLVDNLVAYVSDIPASVRTSPSALEAIALAKDLATLLPADQASATQQRLGNLDVQVIAIGTLLERMLYDKEQIAVQAGKPVEFRFSNSDAMPHNLAIMAPGAMEEIGLLAESTARDADAVQRNYIPKSDKILLASRLLQPGESQSLTFEAPKEPGVYPYVCTYPGHWRRMYGALYVVENLEQYQANPAAYLAAHKPEVKDELLKLVGQTHEWKVDELLEFVGALGHDRSFEVGQNAFKVAACVSCHRMGDQGQQIGPELTKLEPQKLTPEYILRSIIQPSEKIDEKFQSQLIELDSGKVLTGMVLEETADNITLIENPLIKAQPLVIPKSSIEARHKSTKSIMPEGLVSKLTREEILDLIAYVYAKGDKKNELFGAHAGHKH
jgi:putative heme-binding domain-containing protein